MNYSEYTPTTWRTECQDAVKAYSGQIFRFMGKSARKLSSEFDDDEKLGIEINKMIVAIADILRTDLTDKLLGK